MSWNPGDDVIAVQRGPEPGGLGGGDTFTQKFDTAGTIKYVCTVPPGMEGTVTVK